MANLYGLIQSTIHLATKKFRGITFTPLDEGETTERNALDMALRDKDNNHLGDTTNPLKVGITGITEADPLPVTGPVQNPSDPIVFQDGASVAGNGVEANIGAYGKLILHLFGINVATSQVIFEVNDFDDNWKAIEGTRIGGGTGTPATGTTGIATGNNTPGESWSIPCAGFTQIRTRIPEGGITGESPALTTKGAFLL